jgi:cation/acetate symporter
MNPIRRIRHLAGVLAAGVFALLALATASPAMAATERLPRFGPPPPPTGATSAAPVVLIRTVVVGGMPGWQIALIAAGAALLAAAIVVVFDRARASHRKELTAAA